MYLYSWSNALVFLATNSSNVVFNFTILGLSIVPKLNGHTWWSSRNIQQTISKSWTLMHVGVVSTRICPSECGKLNLKSLVSTSSPKIIELKIFSSNSVMVPIVNKFNLLWKIFLFLHMWFSLSYRNTTKPWDVSYYYANVWS